MKTIKVTIPGKPSTWCIRKTGEQCSVEPLRRVINTLVGDMTYLVTFDSGSTGYARDSDLEETPGTPETTREFKVHHEYRYDGRYCEYTRKHMPCLVSDSCTDCIYHYLATL